MQVGVFFGGLAKDGQILKNNCPHIVVAGWQDSGSHQEQEVASQEPETFRPGRVRQDVGAAWYVLFTQSDGFHAL